MDYLIEPMAVDTRWCIIHPCDYCEHIGCSCRGKCYSRCDTQCNLLGCGPGGRCTPDIVKNNIL